MKKKITTVIMAIFTTGLIFTTLPSAQAKSIFYDISENDPHYKAIEWLVQNNIVKGYGDGTFRPYNTVNRAELLKMVFTANGKMEAANAVLSTLTPKKMWVTKKTRNGYKYRTMDWVKKGPFADVSADQWYTKFVMLAKDRGIIQGYADNNFKPANNINKAEAYKIILSEFFNDRTMTFSVQRAELQPAMKPSPRSIPADVKITDWFHVYVNFAALKNLYDAGTWSGTKNGYSFYPGQSISRGEVAELIYRSKTVADNFPNSIENSLLSKYTVNSCPGCYQPNSYQEIPAAADTNKYTFAEASGLASFGVVDENHPNATLAYIVKYPTELLTVNAKTRNIFKFFSTSKPNTVEMSLVVKENPNHLSIQDFYGLQLQNPYKMSVAHDNIKVNTLPAVWFHKLGAKGGKVLSEAVAISFQNSIVEITDVESLHQTNGIFNFIIRNFWFKNVGV